MIEPAVICRGDLVKIVMAGSLDVGVGFFKKSDDDIYYGSRSTTVTVQSSCVGIVTDAFSGLYYGERMIMVSVIFGDLHCAVHPSHLTKVQGPQNHPGATVVKLKVNPHL